ncbi:nuclear transport factor 2 family protein [Burkholderia sp. Ac-20353]|uniref:nuclear transport factor 2 family protein n=1 Tax=Burkholderia sp. Ac-20353 TaxID=2703894 RepID=UPI00197BD5EA|nr:nuclear transport factor 2 family protein [Burkholderia sp. Ac-20353]MBN3786402.1 nuclear transport factor 2 family protein [Burkholderia sp. Ac-20353]
MSSATSRSQLLDTLDAFVDAWADPHVASVGSLLDENVALFSSHRGHVHGKDKVIALLRNEFSGSSSARIAATNRVARADRDSAVVSAYVHGEVRPATAPRDSAVTEFGGVVVLTVETRHGEPLIREIRIQLNWVQGDAASLPGWKLPPSDRARKPGDAPAVIVSELDAPWHRVPESSLPDSDEQAIADAWFRYAWALDQADFVLFAAAFSEQAEAELTPMGHLKGRRELMTTLKAFRMPWTWMQHNGEPLSIEIGPDGDHATMVLGRIMPGRTGDDTGKRWYGAHYRIRLVKEHDDTWKIERMAYFPGWFSA